MNNHQYFLQPYNGIRTRHKCPRCGDEHSFTYYIDEEGRVLNEAVGRCNHESGCGYHYTPAQFFKDNPNEARGERLGAYPSRLPYSAPTFTRQAATISTIPFWYVEKSKSTENGLFRFLSILFDRKEIRDVAEMYEVGSTKSGDVIYWQIDTQNRVRAGKVMRYSPTNGHRVKDGAMQIDWIHSRLKKSGNLPADWNLTQCLFGEHLINKYGNKDKMIALVESEKSALIGAMQFPQYLWLATGGINNFNAERLQTLIGRKILIFPDVDGMGKWSERAKSISCCRFIISDVLEKHASPSEREAKIDIADWIISTRMQGAATQQAATQQPQQAATTQTPALPTIWTDNGMPEFVHQVTADEVEIFENVKSKSKGLGKLADFFGLEVRGVEMFDSVEAQAESLEEGGLSKNETIKFIKGEYKKNNKSLKKSI